MMIKFIVKNLVILTILNKYYRSSCCLTHEYLIARTSRVATGSGSDQLQSRNSDGYPEHTSSDGYPEHTVSDGYPEHTVSGRPNRNYARLNSYVLSMVDFCSSCRYYIML